MNSSTLSLTSELYGVGDQCHAPAALPPGKTRQSLYRRLGGTQGRPVWTGAESLAPLGFDLRTMLGKAKQNKLSRIV